MINKSFSAMILAAGFGKRLHPLTLKIPKPLIKIKNISLLQNSIDLLFSIGCEEIVINTHYKSELIKNFINNNYSKKNIIISYEKEILDTGGGVKQAINLFNNENVLITNCDIFWQKNNILDILSLISDFKNKDKCRLLLVNLKYSHGINKDTGDFTIKDGKIIRWKVENEIFFYSGMQIINLNIFKQHNLKKFSFNVIWDKLITQNSLFGSFINSDIYHVGDIEGLNEVRKVIT